MDLVLEQNPFSHAWSNEFTINPVHVRSMWMGDHLQKKTHKPADIIHDLNLTFSFSFLQ